MCTNCRKIINSGRTGQVNWHLCSHGILVIDGNGNMADYDNDNHVPWSNKLDCISTIDICHGVTNVGSRAFENCSKLTNVILPNSVKIIGDFAFGHCVTLKSIILPNGLESIGAYAFEYCALEEITIPENVKKIDSYAFQFCGFSSIPRLPSHIRKGIEIFYKCISK